MNKRYRWLVCVTLAAVLTLIGATTVTAQPAVWQVEWQAQYRDNANLQGEPALERTEQGLDHEWGIGSPADVAEPGEPWVVLVNVPGPGQKAVSDAFTVTGGQGGPCGDSYVVQPGDTLAQIAQSCRTPLSAILAANPQIEDRNVIEVGMRLTIPASGGNRLMATTEVNLNLRTFPSTDNDPIDVIPAGTTVPVLARSPGGAWIRVLYDNREGWVATRFTDMTGRIDGVPISER